MGWRTASEARPYKHHEQERREEKLAPVKRQGWGTRAVILLRCGWNGLTGQLWKCLEGGGKPLESSTDCFCVSAKADSEVLWLLEEFP